MATESSSLNNLMTVYRWVVEDVVKNVKDEFLNESVDLQVLDELKQLWLSKIDLTRHISRPKDPTPPHPTQPSPRKDRPPPLLSVGAVDKVQPPVQTESVIHHAPPRFLIQTPPQLMSQLQPQPQPQPQIQSQPQLQSQPQPQFQSQPQPQLQSQPQPQPQSYPQPQPASSTLILSPSSTPTTRTAILLPAPGYAGMLPSGAVAASNSIPQIAAVRPAQLVSPPAIVMPSQAAAIAAGLQQTPQMMVPVQTAQGTVIMPLSQILALQAQQRALAVAKATSQQAAAANQSNSPNVDQTDGLPPSFSDDTTARSSQEVEILDSETQPEMYGTLVHSAEKATGEVTASNETGWLCGSYSRTVDDSSTPVVAVPAESFKQQDSASVPIPDCPTPGPAESCTQQDSTPVPIPDHPIPVPNHLELSCKRKNRWRGRPIVQLDGASGGGRGSGKGGKAPKEESSSEEESDDDDTSEEDELEAAGDENPLCSDDDVGDSSEESGEDFETSDTMVCQFEKVYRVKTRWKFQLKDGIMQIGGHDYVFHKAVGEADW